MEEKTYDYLSGFADALLMSKAILLQEKTSKEDYIERYIPMILERVNRLKLADMVAELISE